MLGFAILFTLGYLPPRYDYTVLPIPEKKFESYLRTIKEEGWVIVSTDKAREVVLRRRRSLVEPEPLTGAALLGKTVLVDSARIPGSSLPTSSEPQKMREHPDRIVVLDEQSGVYHRPGCNNVPVHGVRRKVSEVVTSRTGCAICQPDGPG
ncbi:MAG TPA: hypothetical protein VF618_03415 [Thermoanaerobaculia bacterium]